MSKRSLGRDGTGHIGDGASSSDTLAPPARKALFTSPVKSPAQKVNIYIYYVKLQFIKKMYALKMEIQLIDQCPLPEILHPSLVIQI